MDPSSQKQIQEFMGREYSWIFDAGECNFLMHLLAHLVQENPELKVGKDGKTEKLNYQSIRTIVLLNEKLSRQFQARAGECSVVMGGPDTSTEKVQ